MTETTLVGEVLHVECSGDRDPGRAAGSGGSPTDLRCGGPVGPSVGVMCAGGTGGGSILSAHWMQFPGESRDFGDFGRIAPKASLAPGVPACV